MNESVLEYEDGAEEFESGSPSPFFCDKGQRALYARRKIEQIMELRRLRELDDSIQLIEID